VERRRRRRRRKRRRRRRGRNKGRNRIVHTGCSRGHIDFPLLCTFCCSSCSHCKSGYRGSSLALCARSRDSFFFIPPFFLPFPPRHVVPSAGISVHPTDIPAGAPGDRRQRRPGRRRDRAQSVGRALQRALLHVRVSVRGGGAGLRSVSALLERHIHFQSIGESSAVSLSLSLFLKSHRNFFLFYFFYLSPPKKRNMQQVSGMFIRIFFFGA